MGKIMDGKKTYTGIAISFIALVLGMFTKIDLNAEMQTILVENIDKIIAAIGLLIAGYGRLKVKK